MAFALLLDEVRGELGKKARGGFLRLVDEVLQESFVLPLGGDGDCCEPFFLSSRGRGALLMKKAKMNSPNSSMNVESLSSRHADVLCYLSEGNGLKL